MELEKIIYRIIHQHDSEIKECIVNEILEEVIEEVIELVISSIMDKVEENIVERIDILNKDEIRKKCLEKLK